MARLPASPHARHLAAARATLLQERASSMRFSPTDTEAALWQRLRARQLGVTFRRQLVIGRFIADFAAPSVRLLVEVDGGYHARRAAADCRRDLTLQRLGWRILRLPADLVAADLDAALLLVQQALAG